MDSNTNTTNTSSGSVDSVAASNPVGAAPDAQVSPLPANPSISQPQPTQTAPPMQQHKGKSMMWMIVLLLFAFVCGLALAAWYFQTQLQKF